MEMSNFEYSTWQTTAVVNNVIAPYLCRESSEFDEIWYADASIEQGDGNVTKIQKLPNSRWRTDAIMKIIFLAITRVRLRRKLGDRRHIRTHTNFRWRKCPVSKIQHGRRPPFLKPLCLDISAANHPNCTKFSTQTQILPHASETTKKIRNSQIQNGGWTWH